LLRKGVGIHHAGLIPILREMTELLFAKGFIKILFCTETMSVGINLPVKTTIFTDIKKFNGEIVRPLYSHEYTQAAGRAGRLGLDTVGHVIHLNNLFRNVETVSYKKMMDGKPQTLSSKFKISFQLVLNLLSIGDKHLVQFAKKSMVTGDLDSQLNELYVSLQKVNTEIDNINLSIGYTKTPLEIVRDYINLKVKAPSLVNKKRKEVERQIQQYQQTYKTIEQDQKTLDKLINKTQEAEKITCEINKTNKYLQSGIEAVLSFLTKYKFIIVDGESEIELTIKGKIASQIKESHCLAFADLIEDNYFDNLTSKQIVCLLSCFTNINVAEDKKTVHCDTADDTALKQTVEKTVEMLQHFQDEEITYGINTGSDYSYHYDLLSYMEDWCLCEDVTECKNILQNMSREKEIFLGEFVKAILKINNISSELEKIAELFGNISLLSKLREIPKMTMKFVVTNQSLYV
jgi:superfamily II RNA helicase